MSLTPPLKCKMKNIVISLYLTYRLCQHPC